MYMKKMFVICFKELENFYLFFNEISINRFADSLKISYIALRCDGKLFN